MGINTQTNCYFQQIQEKRTMQQLHGYDSCQWNCLCLFIHLIKNWYQ